MPTQFPASSTWAALKPFAIKSGEITTPMHPEYPCAHCTFQAAAAGVLQVLYGDAVPKFTLTSAAAPGVTRSFERLSDYVNEVINGRITSPK